MSVLIADDEKGIRMGLEKLFSREGYETCTAESAKEAMQLIRKKDIRLALLDIRLGSSDGLDLLNRIKEQSPETVCIMITGYGSIDNAVQAMKKRGRRLPPQAPGQRTHPEDRQKPKRDDQTQKREYPPEAGAAEQDDRLRLPDPS